MNRFPKKIFLTVAVLLLMQPFQGNYKDHCQIVMPNSSVVVHSFGDSITYGTGADRLCAGFQYRFTVRVGGVSDNQGRPGALFESELPAILALKEAGMSDVNTLMPGFNDITAFGADPIHLVRFKMNLTKALEHLSRAGKVTIIGTPLDVTARFQSPNHTKKNVELYVKMVKQVVSQMRDRGYPVVLADTHAIFDPYTMTNTNDFHPNNYGHEVLTTLFFRTYLANRN